MNLSYIQTQKYHKHAGVEVIKGCGHTGCHIGDWQHKFKRVF